MKISSVSRTLLITILLTLVNEAFTKSLYSTHISEGIAYYKLEEYDKAIDIFKKASELNPNDPLPYRMIGLSYYRKNILDEALKYLSISLTLEEGDNTITLSIIGNIYYKQKKFNNAVLVYEKLTSLTNSAFFYFRLINSLESIGRLEEAATAGEKFLHNPSWGDFDENIFKSKLRNIYIKLGNKYKKEGLKSKSEEAYSKAKLLLK
ncbi:MAG: tetratricopeptide repeat protein [Brevinematales bacterium]|nr:tetratricopeptide repeat protein [Brevinematales bacterium]